MRRACSHGRTAVLWVAAAVLAATMLTTPAGAVGRTPRNAAATAPSPSCPAPTGANNATVRWGYETLLSRCPDSGGLVYWAAALSEPNGQAEFTSTLANSGESLNDWVNAAYLTTLGRNADLGGLSYWTGRLRNGLHWDQLEATLFATDESYALSNRSNQQFVEDLYELILSRPADMGGLNHWTIDLDAGASRYSVAWTLEISSESELDWAFGLYYVLLGRPPATAEATFVSAYTKLIGDPYKVAAGIAAQPEFSRYAQTLPECRQDLRELCTRPLPRTAAATSPALPNSAADIVGLLPHRRSTR